MIGFSLLFSSPFLRCLQIIENFKIISAKASLITLKQREKVDFRLFFCLCLIRETPSFMHTAAFEQRSVYAKTSHSLWSAGIE